MNLERVHNASRNIAWGLINTFLIIICPFITRTVMLYTLGDLYTGLNGLFTSIIQVLNISEMGISSAITFSMYRPIAEGNIKEVCALLQYYKKCYRFIGVIVLGVGICIMPFLPLMILDDLPRDVNLYTLYLLQLISTFLSYELFAHKISLLIALQRNDLISKVASIVKVIQTASQICILIIFKNYYLFLTVSIITSIGENIFNAIISVKRYPEFVCNGDISKETKKEIYYRVQGMLFHKIGGEALRSIDTIIISSFLGLSALTQYQNYYYIITGVTSIFGVIQKSLIPIFGSSMVTEGDEENIIDFENINYIYIWVSIWASICLLCLYQPFMELWVGNSYLYSKKIVLLFVLYFYFFRWCDVVYIYQEACGLWWETRLCPLLTAIVNFILNIILVRFIGISGILISTIISLISCYNIGTVKVVMTQKFKVKNGISFFFKKQVQYFFGGIIAALACILLCNIIILPILEQFLVNLLICFFVPNIILYSIWYRSEEIRSIKNLLRYILKVRI